MAHELEAPRYLEKRHLIIYWVILLRGDVGQPTHGEGGANYGHLPLTVLMQMRTLQIEMAYEVEALR
jgi:hypothetical protein